MSAGVLISAGHYGASTQVRAPGPDHPLSRSIRPDAITGALRFSSCSMSCGCGSLHLVTLHLLHLLSLACLARKPGGLHAEASKYEPWVLGGLSTLYDPTGPIRALASHCRKLYGLRDESLVNCEVCACFRMLSWHM